MRFLSLKSVKKKLKDKGFARAVNRDEIRNGAEEAGLPFDEHVQFVIEALRPDILVKGADRAGDVVGQAFVESHGGEVRLAPLVEGWSTTDIIGKIRAVYGDR